MKASSKVIIFVCFLLKRWSLSFIIVPLSSFHQSSSKRSLQLSELVELTNPTTTTLATKKESPNHNDNRNTTQAHNCENSSSSSIHLISLPPLRPKESPKLIKDLWKWKDIVLGDGRDYFIPRPRALKALSDILIGSEMIVDSNSGMCKSKNLYTEKYEMIHCIEECAILSNCARMDILLCVKTEIRNRMHLDISCDNDNTMEEHENYEESANHAAKIIVAKCLLDQLSSYQSSKQEKGATVSTLWEGISSFLDLPGMVIENKSNDDTIRQKQILSPLSSNPKGILHPNDIEDESSSSERNIPCLQLSNQLQSKHQISHIINHFCLIASGLAKRDSRPDRDITFRPFSSRDAHIMLQLKRTVDVASSYPRMKIILDTSLNVGKSARDVKKVPILQELKQYDCEGKYSTSAPPKLANDAIEDVKCLVIGPGITNCVERLKAFENSKRITFFRTEVDLLLSALEMEDGNEKVRDDVFVKKIIHETMIKLRVGEDITLENVLFQIESSIRKN